MKNKWFIKCFFGCVILVTRMLLLAVMVLVLTIPGFAKMYEEPKSFSLKDKSLEQVQLKLLPKVDTERLLAEDRARGKDPQHPGPYRFAVAVDVAFTPENSGTWQTLADGRLWRLRIQSPGAKSLNLGITRFDMPDGAKLWIYDPGHKHVEGPYTSRNRSTLGSLWTPIIEGDEIVVEVFVPAGVPQPVVEIGKVNHGYRGFGVKSGKYGKEGICENDVICHKGDPWRDQILAVVLYHANGTYSCTGTLLNNTAKDFKPYILSANHCGVTGGPHGTDASVVVYWNFESATCGTHTGSLTNAVTQVGGAYFRAGSDVMHNDFVLFELKYPPKPSNVFYAGWDATGNTPSSTVGIHHPMADVKAISFSKRQPYTTAFRSDIHDPSGNAWRVVWFSGVTEEGSSGSCLFERKFKRCIGYLHGGCSSCETSCDPKYCAYTCCPPPCSPNSSDWYGRFSVSWYGDGMPSGQLKFWLDHGNTGILTLDGAYHP